VSSLGAEIGLAKTQFFMTDSAQNPGIFKSPKGVPVDNAVLDRIRGTAPATPTGATYAGFSMTYLNHFKDVVDPYTKMKVDPATTAFVANAYDAMYLVALAESTVTDHLPGGSELAASLKTRVLATGTALAVSPNNYLLAVKAMRASGVRLDGASGPLEFDANGDPTKGAFSVWGIDTTGTAPAFKALPLP
jgi:ABC-type branched-subunit amino acid transport system substrate-binding protein